MNKIIIGVSGIITQGCVDTMSELLLQVDDWKNSELVVLINCYGGVLNAAGYIGRHIAEAKMSTAVVTGVAQSAALYILKSCKRAYTTPNGQFMYHDGHIGVHGNDTALEQTLAVLKSGGEEYNRVTLKGVTPAFRKEVKKFKNADMYFGATEAVEYGLVQGITHLHKLKWEDKSPVKTNNSTLHVTIFGQGSEDLGMEEKGKHENHRKYRR